MDSSSRDMPGHWVQGLREGDEAVAQELWHRYFVRLTKVGERYLGNLNRTQDGEDVALSAINSLIGRARQDRIPRLSDLTSLWPLLFTITARKAISERRRQQAGKRDRKAEISLDEIQDYLGDEPSAALVVEANEEAERLFASLGDPVLRRIVELSMAGYQHQEIAEAIGVKSRRTIIRKLKLVRNKWLSLAGETPDDEIDSDRD